MVLKAKIMKEKLNKLDQNLSFCGLKGMTKQVIRYITEC
jgi:hypothetical protein